MVMVASFAALVASILFGCKSPNDLSGQYIGRTAFTKQQMAQDAQIMTTAPAGTPTAQQVSDTIIHLDLNSDGSFTVSAPIGGPAGVPAKSRGKWTVQDNQVVLSAESAERNGQQFDPGPAMKLNISPDKKTLVEATSGDANYIPFGVTTFVRSG